MKKLLILAALVSAITETSCAQRRPLPPRPMPRSIGRTRVRPVPKRRTVRRRPARGRGRSLKARVSNQVRPVRATPKRPPVPQRPVARPGARY